MQEDFSQGFSPEVSLDLINRVRGGDQQAATVLFNRYVERLIGLARSRLSGKVARRVEAEDVVQSVYRSFFHRAQHGQFVFERSGDLWRLLAAITVHKLCRTVAHHKAAKRAISMEQSSADNDLLGLAPEALGREPSPSDAIAMTDELAQIMRQLRPEWQQMLALRLEGCTLDQIATELQRSDRSVRRCFERVREIMQQTLASATAE